MLCSGIPFILPQLLVVMMPLWIYCLPVEAALGMLLTLLMAMDLPHSIALPLLVSSASVPE
jgi:hypothetical protein